MLSGLSDVSIVTCTPSTFDTKRMLAEASRCRTQSPCYIVRDCQTYAWLALLNAKVVKAAPSPDPLAVTLDLVHPLVPRTWRPGSNGTGIRALVHGPVSARPSAPRGVRASESVVRASSSVFVCSRVNALRHRWLRVRMSVCVVLYACLHKQTSCRLLPVVYTRGSLHGVTCALRLMHFSTVSWDAMACKAMGCGAVEPGGVGWGWGWGWGSRCNVSYLLCTGHDIVPVSMYCRVLA